MANKPLRGINFPGLADTYTVPEVYVQDEEPIEAALGALWVDTRAGGLLYRLSQSTIFDGVDDYIDTGLKLLDEAKDFTIICDCTLPTNVNAAGIYNCYTSGNGDTTLDAGLTCGRHLESNQYFFAGKGASEQMLGYVWYEASTVRHALVYKGGIPHKVYILNDDGTVLDTPFTNSVALIYRSCDATLHIGCGRGWWNSRNSFADMTMNNFEVWDYAMSASQAAERLNKIVNTAN